MEFFREIGHPTLNRTAEVAAMAVQYGASVNPRSVLMDCYRDACEQVSFALEQRADYFPVSGAHAVTY